MDEEQQLERLREQMIQMLRGIAVNKLSDTEEENNEDGDYDATSNDWYASADGLEFGDNSQEEEEEDEDEDTGQGLAVVYDEDDNEDEYSAADEWYQPLDNLDSEKYEDVPEEEVEINGNGDLSMDNTSEISQDDKDRLEQETEPTEKKKKKRKSKKNKKKKKNLPYADDDEAEIEILDLAVSEQLYDPSSSADSRFRLAIENYRKERNFTAMSSQILSTYFTYGGMDEHNEVDDYATTYQTKKRLTCGIEVEIEADIDLCYVVSSFLSSHLFNRSIWHDEAYFIMAPKVLSAFLKYILLRRVLPEFQQNVEQAVQVTEMAKVEVPRCKIFNEAMMQDDLVLTCLALFVPAFSSTELPESSLKLMQKVIGIRSADEVVVEGQRIWQGRVVEKIQSEDEGMAELAVQLVLEKWSGQEKDDLTEAQGQGQERVMMHMSPEAAAMLVTGNVVWGTFYALSNGFIFARPLMALPSFYEPDMEASQHDL